VHSNAFRVAVENKRKTKNKERLIMSTNYVGIYRILEAWPIWAVALLLYTVTLGMIFILRDKCEGVFYNTSYSAMLGDGALIVAVLLAAEILKRGGVLPGWMQLKWLHWVAFLCGVLLGVVWCVVDLPEQWADAYHHIMIAPLLVYLGITLLPVIWVLGTHAEKLATLFMVLLWATLVVYDAKTERLNQRKYRDLGIHLTAIQQVADAKADQR